MKNFVTFGIMFLVMLAISAVSVFAAPTLTAIGGKSVDEGDLLSFTVTASDPDAGTANVYTICNAVTSGGTCTGSQANGVSSVTIATTTANFTNSSNTQATFAWEPDFSQVGEYFINFSVSDDDSTDSEVVKITVNDVAPIITVNDLSLGGRNQKRSNPNHDDKEDRVVNVTGQITIINPSGDTIKNLAASSVIGLGKYSNAFVGSTVSFDKTEINPGGQAIATVTLNVPKNLDAVDNSLVESAFNVAQITFTATDVNDNPISSVTSTVSMQAENNLRFEDGRIRFDGKSEKIDDDDEVDKIKPGMNVEIELEIESRYDDKDDVEIQDAEVIMESIGDEDDLDVDEDADVDDLGPEDTETIEIEFDIEDDAAKGDEDLLITVEGFDEHGARHGERWRITLEIEREDHEIEIRNVDLNPSSVSCQETAIITVGVRNTGRDDEEAVFIRVHSLELNNYQQNLEIGDLDEDDETSHRFTVPVPLDTKAGTYRLTIETYYDVGKKSDTDGIILTKTACGVDEDVVVTPVDDDDREPIIVVTPPPAPVVQPPITGEVVAPPADEEGFFESQAYVALLILGYVVVLGGGILVAIKLLRR